MFKSQLGDWIITPLGDGRFIHIITTTVIIVYQCRATEINHRQMLRNSPKTQYVCRPAPAVYVERMCPGPRAHIDSYRTETSEFHRLKRTMLVVLSSICIDYRSFKSISIIFSLTLLKVRSVRVIVR
jgi:hypothetical protein